MRIIKAFGQHIDLDPIVQISEWRLGDVYEASATYDHMRYTTNSTRLKVCSAVYLLRSDNIVYTVEWPEWKNYKYSDPSLSSKEALELFKEDCRVAFNHAKMEYDFFLQSWKENRPNYLELAVLRHH